MSITIDWASLTTGPAGLALADSIRDFIHDKFQQVALPRFIRSVQVHSFDFGEEGPEVELKDISDPFPEFYEDDGDDDDDDDEEEGEAAESSEGEEAVSGAIVAAPASTAPKPPIDAPHRAPTTVPPPAIDPRPPNPTLRAGFPFPPPPADQISTPFLSRSSTPGLPIPGGTANFGYFHLPLGAGLSGTQTPLLPWGEQQQQQQQPRPPSPLRRERGHDAAFGPAVPRGESNTPRRRRDQRSPSRGSYTAGPAEPDGGGGDPTTTTEDRSQDLQTTLHISYSGTVALSLTAEILLDYPMPSFVGIPLQLRITGLSFDGVAVLAYLRHPGAAGDAERRKVHFCFLGREDAKATVGDEGGVGDGGEEGPGGLLREIRVESEIGRQEGGKQVLKNVGKVEKFVLEQVRRIFEDEFVWPSFWTFLV